MDVRRVQQYRCALVIPTELRVVGNSLTQANLLLQASVACADELASHLMPFWPEHGSDYESFVELFLMGPGVSVAARDFSPCLLTKPATRTHLSQQFPAAVTSRPVLYWPLSPKKFCLSACPPPKLFSWLPTRQHPALVLETLRHLSACTFMYLHLLLLMLFILPKLSSF